MTEAEYARIINAQRRLPEQIERAERRLEHLYRQAARMGMHELLANKEWANVAWEAEVAKIKREARGRGQALQ